MMEKVLAFAKENGYETVERCKDWNGYKCFEPVMHADAISFIGPPLLILVKGDTIRMSTVEEAFRQIEETEGDEEDE